MKRLRPIFGISPFVATKGTGLALLSCLLVLFLASCDPDDENGGPLDKASQSLQSLCFSVSAEKQNVKTRSDMVSGNDESFTFRIGENNDCEIACIVTDMEGNVPVTLTRGTPIGTTVPYLLDGTTPVISSVTNSIESIYGTDGLAITAYRKDKDDNVSLFVPNSKIDAENTASVASFKNLTYTYNANAFGTGVGSWTTASNISGYYWREKEKLRFYAAAPATLTPGYDAAAGTASFSYTVPADNANQKDVLIGAIDFLTRPTLIKDKAYSMEVELPTYHALCAVRFVIDNRELGAAPSYTQRPKDFTLKSITLTNLKTGGICTYTYNSSSSATSADCVVWNLASSSTGDYSCTFNKAIAKTNATCNLHSSDGSASGTQLTNVFLLVPQELVEDCKVEITYSYNSIEYNSSTGTTTYTPVDCSISGQLVGSGATKDSGGVYTSYGSWQPGKMYTYVISSKYIKRGGTLYKIDGTISYNSQTKKAPNNQNNWGSITDFPDPAGATPGKSYPGSFTIDVSDVKYIELSWSDITVKFVANTTSYTTAAHIWLEGTTWDNTYQINGTPYTGGKSTTNGSAVNVMNNGTGTFHDSNPANDFTYPYDGNGNSTTQVYTDVYVYEKLIKASPGSYSDGTSKTHKWVFDVRDYQSIKIPVFFYNDQTGGGSCSWELTDFTVKALESEDW